MPTRTENLTAMCNSVCYKADELKGGSVVKKNGRTKQYAGGYKNVYPFTNKNGDMVAVCCFCANIDQAKERSQRISEFLAKDKSHYFVNFKYVSNALLVLGVLQPVVIMDWVDGQTLKNYVSSQKLSPQLFLDLAEKFLQMVKYLHSKNMAHGDLQHGNIMIRSNGSMALIDYDSMYIDDLNGMTDVVKGLPGYQHPARAKNRLLTPKLDYFSELIIYLSLHIFAENPKLWDEYVDTEDFLFSAADFTNIQQSKLYKQYYNSANPTIRQLMQQLEVALSKDDINDLSPLEVLLGDTSNVLMPVNTTVQMGVDVERILSKVVVKPRPAAAEPQLPDIAAILKKIDNLVIAVETHRKMPEIDIRKIIEKFSKSA